MAAPFIGAEDLGAFLHTTVDPDALITKIALNTACKAVTDYCDNPLVLEEDVELRLDGTGKSGLLLPKPPVREVTTVIEAGVELVEESAPGDGGDYYQYTPTTWGLLKRVGGVWPLVEGVVLVTYSRGYDVGTGDLLLPDTIRAVALELAADLYSAGNVARGGLTGETIGDYSYTRDSSAAELSTVALSKDQQRALDPYAIRRVA